MSDRIEYNDDMTSHCKLWSQIYDNGDDSAPKRGTIS